MAKKKEAKPETAWAIVQVTSSGLHWINPFYISRTRLGLVSHFINSWSKEYRQKKEQERNETWYPAKVQISLAPKKGRKP